MVVWEHVYKRTDSGFLREWWFMDDQYQVFFGTGCLLLGNKPTKQWGIEELVVRGISTILRKAERLETMHRK